MPSRPLLPPVWTLDSNLPVVAPSFAPNWRGLSIDTWLLTTIRDKVFGAGPI